MLLISALLAYSLTIPDFGITTTLHFKNTLPEEIVDMYYLQPGLNSLGSMNLSTHLATDSVASVEIPFVYVNNFFWETASGDVYTLGGYSPKLSADTIEVSLANKEFGNIFNRFYGAYPLSIVNSTGVPITSIQFTGTDLPDGNLMHENILLPREVLRVWVDSGTTVQVTALDAGNNTSTSFAASSFISNNVYQILPSMFFHNGEETGNSDSHAGSWVVNSVTLGKIASIETFSSDGYFLDGLDCSSAPLNTWDKVFIQHNIPIDFVVLTDEAGRTFSANTVDSLTGVYILDDLNLDFGFEFPKD